MKKIKILTASVILSCLSFAAYSQISCTKTRETIIDIGFGVQITVSDWECSNGCSSSTANINGTYIGASEEQCAN